MSHRRTKFIKTFLKQNTRRTLYARNSSSSAFSTARQFRRSAYTAERCTEKLLSGYTTVVREADKYIFAAGSVAKNFLWWWMHHWMHHQVWPSLVWPKNNFHIRPKQNIGRINCPIWPPSRSRRRTLIDHYIQLYPLLSLPIRLISCDLKSWRFSLNLSNVTVTVKNICVF